MEPDAQRTYASAPAGRVCHSNLANIPQNKKHLSVNLLISYQMDITDNSGTMK